MAQSSGQSFWARLFAEYAAAHQSPANQLVHLVFEPVIVATIPAIYWWPVPALCMFALGWASLWTSHLVFEKNIPASWKQPLHVLVGPVWVIGQFVTRFRQARRAA